MNKVLVFVCAVALALLIVAPAMAETLGCYNEGSDVMCIKPFIDTVPGATADNVWWRNHNSEPTWVKMKLEGNLYRAPGVAGKDGHPYVGDPVGNYQPKTNFCKIEQMPGWAEAPFVKWTGGKPWAGTPFINTGK